MTNTRIYTMRETPCGIEITHRVHTFIPMGSVDEQIEKCPGHIDAQQSKPLAASICTSEERHAPHVMSEQSFCVGY